MEYLKNLNKEEYLTLIRDELLKLNEKFWNDIQQKPLETNRFERSKQLLEFGLLREQIKQWYAIEEHIMKTE